MDHWIPQVRPVTNATTLPVNNAPHRLKLEVGSALFQQRAWQLAVSKQLNSNGAWD